jgi:NADH-quinone oxidoreductase subunit J
MGSLGHLAVSLFQAPSLATGGIDMNPYRMGIYIACAVGAIALMLIMPREKPSLAKVGTALGAIALGGFWVYILREQAPQGEPEFAIEGPSFLYQYVFSGIAVFSAVRVITHKQPVFSALWFIMVVLASAGLLLTLNAEFIAFAMVIIYGGAILVTYVFVIMLAAQAGDPAVDKGSGNANGLSFDNKAKDPVVGTIVGFFLLAMLLSILLNPTMKPVPATAQVSDQRLIEGMLTQRKGTLVYTMPGTHATIPAKLEEAARAGDVLSDKKLDNTERVGVDLFKNHPLGLELAGVILLLSLVGAVVIARKRVETEAPPTGH